MSSMRPWTMPGLSYGGVLLLLALDMIGGPPSVRALWRTGYSSSVLHPCREWGPFSWLPSVDGRRVLGVLLVRAVLPPSLWGCCTGSSIGTCAQGAALLSMLINSAWGVVQSGDGETSVGATRLLRIGEQQLFEKLVAIDDEEHILWVPTRSLWRSLAGTLCLSELAEAGKLAVCDG